MKKKTGFTLIELLVVVAIIAVLVAILLPSLAKARSFARQLTCSANLSLIGKAWRFYGNDYQGKVPVSHDDWRAFCDWSPSAPCGLGMLVKGRYVMGRNSNPDDLNAYLAYDLKDRGVLACPSTAPLFKIQPPGWWPVWNTYVVDYRNGRFRGGAYFWGQTTNAFTPDHSWVNYPDWGNLDKMSGDRAQVACLFFMHPGGSNVMFADGHVSCENIGMTIPEEGISLGFHALVDRHYDIDYP